MNISIIKRIKKEFYITDYPTGLCGYLTPDGKWVHLILKEDEDKGGWSRNDHRCVGRFLNHSKKYEDESGTEKMYRFMKRGYIRFSPESNGFEFAVRPTREQARAIYKYQKDLGYDSDIIVERTCEYYETKTIGNIEDFIEYCQKENILCY